MNVKQLKERLEHFPEDLEIIVATDEEGNYFNTLEEIVVSYTRSEGWDIRPVHRDDITDDPDNEDFDGYFIGDLVQRVVIWP